MLAPVVAALVALQSPAPAAAAPQGPVDAARFTDSVSGIGLARPFPDWVFEPDRSRSASRVIIFHPAAGSLGDMFWGALAISAFRRAVPLGQLARQRVTETWQPTLGPSFQLLTRDSLTLQGYPAIHLIMSGAINQAALEVEEYLIARGSDFIALQFRYPRALPHDSIARGYRTALAGLRLAPPSAAVASALPPDSEAPSPPQPSAAPPPAATPASDTEAFTPPPWRTMWSLLKDSPWRLERVDASIRLDDTDAAPSFVVRLDVINDGLTPAQLLPLWIPLGATLDSIQLGRAGSATVSGPQLADETLQLPDTVPFQGRFTVTAFYRRGPLTLPAAFIDDWLPVVQSPWDSLGRGRATDTPRVTLRFDLPRGLTAVATGRLAAEVRGADRHLETWTADGVSAALPGFAIGSYAASAGTAGRLTVTLWDQGVDESTRDSCAHLVADAWAFDARAFGLVTLPEVNVVIGSPVARGLPGLLLLTPAAAMDPARVRQEMARTWWGGAVRGAGAGTAWIEQAFPAFVARAAGDTLGTGAAGWRSAATPPLAAIVPASGADIRTLRTAGAAALDALRQAVGDAIFRAALRTLAVNFRGGFASAEDVLDALPEAGKSALRPYLFGN